MKKDEKENSPEEVKESTPKNGKSEKPRSSKDSPETSNSTKENPPKRSHNRLYGTLPVGQNLADWLKPPTTHVGANANLNISNRNWSVKGAFGVGAIGFLTYSGYCFCTKKPCARLLLTSIAFGGIYLFLDNRDRTTNRKASKNDALGSENKGAANGDNNNDGKTKPYVLKKYNQLNDVAAYDPNNWFVDGYVAKGLVNFLAAGAGVGKSLFMVQIAFAVATGTRVQFLPDDCIVPQKTNVIFYRIEVFAGEYSEKYGDGKMLVEAGINFRDRSELDRTDFKGLIGDLWKTVEYVNEDTLVFIDPLTGYDDCDAGKFADEASKLIIHARTKGFCLSFLCSIHLDEKEEWKTPTTVDIRGGDRLIQVAGSVSAICKERTDEAHRYFKRLKEPKGFAGTKGVLVCKIVPGDNFPHGEYVCHKSVEEARPLRPKAETEDSDKSGERIENVAAPKRKPNIVWTEEMNSRLQELHEGGENDSQITKKMSEEYHLDLTSTQIDRQLQKLGIRPPKPIKVGGAKK